MADDIAPEYDVVVLGTGTPFPITNLPHYSELTPAQA